jgi:hypothetical protein
MSNYLRTPLRFEQVARGDHGAEFVARGAGYGVYLSGGHATVALGTPAKHACQMLTMRLVGSKEPTAVSRSELPGRTHYFIGKNPRAWQTGGRSYGAVEYRDVYAGIDLVYYGNQRQLEYDFVVAAGANPRDIAFDVDGATNVTLDSNGNLVISTSAGDLIHRAPTVYQETDGTRKTVDGEYVIRRDGTIGFDIGAYDTRLPLVIDPILSYASYLGGTKQERVNDVAVDAHGNMFIVGETFSADFPVVGSAPVRSSLGDVFVAKLNRSGDTLEYVTYLGGGNHETSKGLDVDAAGSAYVVGDTFSWDFPTANAMQPAFSGESDIFVVKLDANGGIVYSTLLGGARGDYGNGIQVDGMGRVHIGGSTVSVDMPVVNAMQASLAGHPAFRTTDGGNTWTGLKTGLNAGAVRTFAIDPANPATVYAGTEADGVFRSTDSGTSWTRASNGLPPARVYSLAVSVGSPAVIYAATLFGVFRSHDEGESWMQLPLPGWAATSVAVTPGAPSTIYAALGPESYVAGVFKSMDGGDTWEATGLSEGVVAMALSGSTVYAATATGIFVNNGGAGWIPVFSGLFNDWSVLVADPSNPSVAYAGNFDGLFKTTSAGAEWMPIWMFSGGPVMAAAIAPSDPSTVFVASGWGVMVSNDAGENWRPSGSSNTAVFGLAVDHASATTAYMGAVLASDAYVATLSADGSRLEYATYFGGSDSEGASDLALDPQGARYITGMTFSRDLPVKNAVQPQAGDLMDVFAAKVGGSGDLTYATYLAGWHSDYAPKIDVDAQGRAHVVGLTLSTNFPLAHAFQSRLGGSQDVFVSVLNATGNAFVHSTFLGGSSMENDSLGSLGPDVAVTPSGDTLITGTTMSANFPVTADARQRLHAGGVNDAFITRFDAAGRVRYSTFLGGAGADYARAITAGGDSGMVVAGYTTSVNWPTVNPVQPTYAGSEDGFIARFSDDVQPPATHVTLAGTQGYEGWYRSSVQVTLSAIDGAGGTGISTIQYRVNGGQLQTYTGPFTIAVEGTTHITAQATDKSGNTETPAAAAAVMIDTSGPTVGITSPHAREYVRTDAMAVAFSATDSVSGMAGTPAVMLDGAPLTSSAVDLLTMTLGTHTVTVSAIDLAGNLSQQSVTFRMVATIDSLVGTLDAWRGEMDRSAYNSLLSKLTDARDALGRGNLVSARNKLEDVVAYCNRQRGQAISERAATSLAGDAEYVIATLQPGGSV